MISWCRLGTLLCGLGLATTLAGADTTVKIPMAKELEKRGVIRATSRCTTLPTMEARFWRPMSQTSPSRRAFSIASGFSSSTPI